VEEIKKLPQNWLKNSVPVAEAIAADYKRWLPNGGIMIDDDCPMQINIIVVNPDGKNNLQVLRVKDSFVISLLLDYFKYPEELQKIYKRKNPRLIANAPYKN
jgi:hypothetical protein